METTAVVGAAIALAVVLGILYTLVGAIMEFVFVESLRRETVSIRRYWDNRWSQGLRLFGFRILIGLPLLAIASGWFVLFFVPVLAGIADPFVPFGVFFIGPPVIFVVGLLYALVSAFTTVFVVPLMILYESGVLEAWKRLWDSIKAEPREYLAYAAIGFVLNIAAGLLASIAVAIGAIVLLVPVGLLAVLAYALFTLSTAVGVAVFIALGLGFGLAMAVLWALVQVPVVTYLRLYALLVLGDIEASFDLVPDRREQLATGSNGQN